MDDLIQELEQAQEGSRELDAYVWWTVDKRCAQMPFFHASLGKPQGQPDDWNAVPKGLGRHGVIVSAPHYTTNLQDALGLVPPNHMWSVMYDPGDDETIVECLLDEWRGGRETGGSYRPGPEVVLKGEKPALALTIACLKAIKENQDAVS